VYETSDFSPSGSRGERAADTAAGVVLYPRSPASFRGEADSARELLSFVLSTTHHRRRAAAARSHVDLLL
jgi:hypothetical protein